MWWQAKNQTLCLGDTLFGAFDGDSVAVSNYLSREAPTVIGVRGNCDHLFDERVLGFALPEEQNLVFSGHRLFLRHAPFYVDAREGDVMMYGHTHVPTLKKADGVTYVNPGSISFPKGGFPPTYAVMDGSRVEIRNLDDDIPILAMDLI